MQVTSVSACLLSFCDISNLATLPLEQSESEVLAAPLSPPTLMASSMDNEVTVGLVATAESDAGAHIHGPPLPVQPVPL